MTRQEFIDDVTTWDGLLNFCWDEELYSCENVYMQDSFNDLVSEWVADYDGGWGDLRDDLNNIPTDWYDVYVVDGAFDVYGSDDGDETFENYKESVYNEAIRSDCFEEEYDDTHEEDESSCEINVQVPEEPELIAKDDFSEEFLVSICKSNIQVINDSYK